MHNMKKKILLPLLIASLLASCDQGQCQHVDEDKNHLCDLCGTPLSEHKDEDNNHFCDYCGDQLDGCYDDDLDEKCDKCGKDLEPVVPFAEWPEKEIQDLVVVVSGSETVIPHYNKADDIEINTDDLVENGYFSIYCYTENKYSENEYNAILKAAGWDVEDEKDENGYYNAWDETYEVWVNFFYNEEYTDLEICVTRSLKTGWPGEEISKYLKMLVPGTKTTIPQFEADTVLVNYYDLPSIHAIAINAYGFKDTIIDDYKLILADNNWSVSFNDTSKEWNAFSKDNDVEIHFYIDDSKNEFNVDVLSYRLPVKDWPYEEIAQAIKDMGVTGEILPFFGESSGFKVDYSSVYFAIFITCPKANFETNVTEYNQMLVDAGYVAAYEMMGETLYAYPGTTLAYHATVLDNVFQIETMKLDEPAK